MSHSKKNDKKWRVYERIIAAIEAENSNIEMSITPNAKIIGSISKQERQIDVLVDARWGDDLSKRVIIDAKLFGAKLDIKDVESFEGMMRDCSATHGILVCPRGWTEGAQRRAQDAITIRLLSLEEVENSDLWAHFGECRGECYNKPKKRVQVGMVLWDAQHILIINNLYAIIFTGKCDICHNFHIWCWDCGKKFAVDTEDEYTCSCERIWVSAIEEDIDDVTGQTLNAVHLLLSIGNAVVALDRIRLR